MIPAFVLTFREALEAALIMGILLGVLEKTNRRNLRIWIWSGAALAVIASIAAGALLNYWGASYEGRAEETFEGTIMLLAAGFLTWTIFWLKAQSKEERMRFDKDAQQAATADNRTTLFAITFLSVLREGIELALFLTAALIQSEGVQVLTGSVLGFAVVLILSIVLFKGLTRLDISKFFRVTSVFLIMFAAGLVAHGVHELNEAGIIPEIIEHVWDINHILDENSFIGQILKALTGYNGNPSLTEVIAYIVYLGFVIVFSIRSGKKTKQAAE